MLHQVAILELDLLAGTSYGGGIMLDRTPTILVFDSGLGGLTVFSELTKALAGAHFVYAADDAAFPYGRLEETQLVERVVDVIGRLLILYRPDAVVIACNTASTLVLPALRAAYAVPFVGTVPAVKPAAERTGSGLISVLATPGTVRRDYTRALVQAYAAACSVTLVGATRLASYAEAALRGEPVDDAAIGDEIAPCFVEFDGRRTDVVVLACTHYPLLLDRLQRLAPWPVHFIDPAAAIARRAADVIGPFRSMPGSADATMVLTGGEGVSVALRDALHARGLARIEIEPMPLGLQ